MSLKPKKSNTDKITSQSTMQTINIHTDTVELEGFLTVPKSATGLVVFVHGSGSSRFSERNQYVAERLNRAGLATLLFDLLTSEESAIDTRTREYRFNIDLLSQRTIATVDWIADQQPLEKLSIGLFGASTGAAAALVTAKARANEIECIVLRGGRPDLAVAALPEVIAPTLLIVGSRDIDVLHLNQLAKQAMKCECKLITIEGATHLFEELGTLKAVTVTAREWFLRYLEE
ncbi:dienelactone hydrolase family protein [Thiomicrorhabdus arctica]|jgi:dienelactone hydrolase|uniref:dienelactone hydrolase family protein n=1 Tax=Thiomicrorhabdus arctica TaxID=131540 RepID=UPI000362CF25|nr:alpha/beta family hydrolase [Thiomicrorhabdus arctica]